MQRLLREANERRWSVYLLGGEPHVVEALVWRLANSHPGLRIVGSHHGYFREEERGLVVAAAAGCQPDLLFVALGSPLQEYVIAELPEPGPRVSLGVGGSFDVLAGFKRDAPGWARGRGLEWLFRVAQDPARYWKRYAVTNSWFVATVLREWLHSRTAS
jgi:N-acetylglucosaminyldiphosphoundecaprenol N-acetyl-beta-D-mannosaminyltransferase